MDDARSYVRKTLRSVGILVVCAVLVLANLGLSWAILPLLTGLALAVLLLLGWWMASSMIVAGARQLSDPTEKSRQKKRAGGLIMAFALVKYPLVAVLIWWLTHVWTARELCAFLIGFLLLHVVIALRAVGKLLHESAAT